MRQRSSFLIAGGSAVLALSCVRAAAEDAITTREFELYPTLNNVSVYLRYSGDDNANGRASLEYAEAGGEWRPAHPPVRIDEKKLGGRNWTGSLLFLKEGTAYDVRLRVEDADGVRGRGEFAARVATRESPSPSGGATIVVNPGESIQAAVERASPSTTVLVRKGVYYQMVTAARSGAPGAPITIRGEPGAKIFGSDPKLARGEGWRSEGEGVYSAEIAPVGMRLVAHEKLGRLYHFADLKELRAQTHYCKKAEGKPFRIQGGWTQAGNTLYVRLPDGSDPRKGGVHVSVREACFLFTSSRHVTIQGFELAYVGDRYGACLMFKGCSNVWVHRNRVHHFRKRGIAFSGFPGDDNLVENNEVTNFPVGEWPWRCCKGHDCEDSAISFRSGRGNVARHNFVHNLFNGIDPASFGMGPEYSRDCDVHDNYIVTIGDDALEPDGYAVNQRIYRNVILDTVTMAFSLATVDTGPAYIVRNVICNYGRYIFKAHNSTRGHVFIYHNSSYVDPEKVDPSRVRVFNADPACGGIVARNNAFWAYAYMIRRLGRFLGPCSFDYNAYFNPEGSYNFQWGVRRASSLGAFQALGQEKNGFVANPGYLNPGAGDLALGPGSPLRDRGTVVPGINDHTPDGRPDIGAYEIGRPRWERAPRLPLELASGLQELRKLYAPLPLPGRAAALGEERRAGLRERPSARELAAEVPAGPLPGLAEARALAAKGDYAAAAGRLEEEIPAAADRAAELRGLASGFRAAEAMRSWIARGVASGRGESLFVRTMGVRLRGKVIAADGDGLVVLVLGRESRMGWAELAPAAFLSLARKYAREGGELPAEKLAALELFARACALEFRP